MTYKEKLMIERPHKIDDSCLGGCRGCPGDIVPGAPKIFMPTCPYKIGVDNGGTCDKCWNTEIPEEATDTKPTTTEPTTSVDIHKIIDDAMEKKDRSVTIFIGEHGTTVNVYPYPDEKPRWVTRFVDCGTNRRHSGYRCSECGEKLAAPMMKEATDE